MKPASSDSVPPASSDLVPPVSSDSVPPAAGAASRRPVWGLSVLFGAIYFVQGLAEPTEGLIAQPVRSLLKSWGHSATEIGAFAALLSLPWAIKPVYGLCTDLLPLRGSRRRNYLIVTTAISSLGLFVVFFISSPAEAVSLEAGGRAGAFLPLLALLLVPTIGVAFSDVVTDALMVEAGRARGITGRLQSVQWAALYAATILTGLVGGYLSSGGRQQLGFLICAVVLALSSLLTWACAREEPGAGQRSPGFVWQSLRLTFRHPGVWSVALFLFLWNFNPFSTSVLYLHMTRELQFPEMFYGTTVSILALGSLLASVAYGLYCRRVRFRWLVHGSIVAGVLNTLAYWGMHDMTSARLVAFAVGLAYMTGTLVQLDLAARSCDPASAGTTFALLMAVCNLGISSSAGIGGWLYDTWSQQWGAPTAFRLLVGVGAGCTALCWCLVPFLRDGEKPPAQRGAGRTEQ